LKRLPPCGERRETVFGIGMQELLIILAVALIVLGPKKLPELARSLGRLFAEFQRTAQDLRSSVDFDEGGEFGQAQGEKKEWEEVEPELPPPPGSPEEAEELSKQQEAEESSNERTS
jgi:Tat protein translocase TatB subunit